MSESKPPHDTLYSEQFPDAVSVFQTQYRRLAAVSDDCIVVIDTNALLLPYKTGSDSLAQIRATYTELAKQKRLVIPGHVAREFAVNRPAKLTELSHAISQKQDMPGPKSGSYPLLEESEKYQTVRELEGQLRELLTTYRKAVRTVLAEVRDWTWDDPVSEMYRDVFSAPVVIDPAFDEQEVAERLQHSIKFKTPPGYKDGGKPINATGDLRVWLTILELGASKGKDLILVSGDGKPDWSHRSNSTPLYPRFELVDEYRRASNGKSFHIVQFSAFLKLFGADTKVVAEVQSTERTLRLEALPHSSRHSALALLAEQAVFTWLIDTFPMLECQPVSGRAGHDFLLWDKGGCNTAIIVKFVSNVRAFPYSKHIALIDQRLEEMPVDNAWLILVTDEERSLAQMVARLNRPETPNIQGISVFPATLSADGSLHLEDTFGLLPKF